MKRNNYVIATKYSDGDPRDHFVVGFFKDMTWHGRYSIVDGNGQLFRHNGFRRAKVITQEMGDKLIKEMPFMECSSRSVWSFVTQFEKELNNPDKKQ